MQPAQQKNGSLLPRNLQAAQFLFQRLQRRNPSIAVELEPFQKENKNSEFTSESVIPEAAKPF
jgi:hypothetical protein